MTLTTRSIITMVAAAGSAIALPWQVATILVLLVVAVAAGDAWTVRMTPVLVRSMPEILSRGVPGSFEVKRSEAGRSRERAIGRITLQQPTPADLVVSPKEAETRLLGSITALRRGSHEVPPTATLSTGPLGMGGWFHESGTASKVTVFPDMHAARRLVMAVRTGSFRDEGRRTRGPLGLGTDFESIREYHPDDDIRQLNIRATARTGTPMTNRYRIEQDRDVICLIDCGRLMRAPIGDRTRLDAAVDVAAAIAAVADEVGDRVGVLAFRDRIIRNVRPARDNGNVVAWAIHDLEPEPVESDYRLALQAITGAKRAFVLILTDLMDETAAASLSEMAQTVARKHSLTVAGVRDDHVWSLMSTPATDIVEALETAVAADLMAETERVAAILGSRGATVVEAPVAEFSHRCVAAYLDAKRRARL